MSEVQNTEQGTTTPVQNKKKFLDYIGLQKFWELIKPNMIKSISATPDDENGGISISLTSVDDSKKTVTIPTASTENDGLMTKDQVELLNSKIEGIGFGDPTTGKFKPAVVDDIEVKTTVGDETVINTYSNYLNLDFIVEDNELRIIDRNSEEKITVNTGEKDESGNDITEEITRNTVLSKVQLSDIFQQGFISNSDFTSDESGNIWLELTFNYVDGTEATEKINISDLVSQYSAGNGLQLLNVTGEGLNDDKHTGEFSIKIKDGEKYLKVDASGLQTQDIESTINETIDNKLSNYTSGKTTSDILISGGPLASEVSGNSDTWPADWRDDSGRRIIPTNKTLQDVLTTLFTDIKEGTLNNPVYGGSISLNIPSISNTSSGTVEVGTEVTSSISVNQSTASNTRTVTIKSNPIDYKLWKMKTANFNEDGTPNETDAEFEKLSSGSVTVNATEGYSENLETIKLTEVTVPTGATLVTGENIVNDDYKKTYKYTITEGSNTVYVKQSSSSLKINPGKFGNCIYYASNSIGERLPNKYVSIHNDQGVSDTTSKYSTNTTTITGARRVWYGTIEDATKVIDFSNADNNSNGTVGNAIRNLTSESTGVTITTKWASDQHAKPSAINIKDGTKQVLIVLKNTNDNPVNISEIIDKTGYAVKSAFRSVQVKILGLNNYAAGNNMYTVWYSTPADQQNGLTANEYKITY